MDVEAHEGPRSPMVQPHQSALVRGMNLVKTFGTCRLAPPHPMHNRQQRHDLEPDSNEQGDRGILDVSVAGSGAHRGVVAGGLGATHAAGGRSVEVLLHNEVHGRALPGLQGPAHSTSAV